MCNNNYNIKNGDYEKMFTVYNQNNFHEWYQLANKIAENEVKEYGNGKNKFIPLSVERKLSDYYLIFTDPKAGTCGAAVLTSRPFTFSTDEYYLEIASNTSPWILKDVYFHIENKHPIHEDHHEFSRVIEKFYLGLFKKLWEFSSEEKKSIALVFDPLADCEYESLHESLKFFGGFKFSKKIIEQTDKSCIALGVLSLTKDTYNCFLTKENLHRKTFKYT